MTLVINFSGGADSSMMLLYLCQKYPDAKKIVVFANTGWEHPDAEEWCRKIVALFNLELHVVRNPNKTFLTMVEKRGKFPSAKYRQCTSDLKRGPIQTFIRQHVNDDVIINCMGIRADESPARGKRKKLSRDLSMTNGKRTVWNYLPIFEMNKKDVFYTLEDNNIPIHPAYLYLKRFSCRICIYFTEQDLKQTQIHDPEAVDIINKLERKINFSMSPGGFVKEILRRTIIPKTYA